VISSDNISQFYGIEEEGDYNSDDDEVVDNEMEASKRKRVRRQRVSSDDLWKSPWGVLIRHPEVSDPTSLSGTKFRLRFRVPFSLFNDVLIPMCERVNIFRQKNRSAIPLEFKVLI
jgi:hypothetical protein